MAKLDIIMGPMFSGKSCELIRRIRLLKVLNKDFLVIKPKLDNRYSKDSEIVTHNLDKESCLVVDKLSLVNNLDYHTIFIDEGQFFPDLKEFVLYALEELNINIIITGLDGDFQRNMFGDILKLIPYSDNIIKQKALCKKCNDGTLAIFTHRLNDNKNQISIGTSKEYVSLCRKCYLCLN